MFAAVDHAAALIEQNRLLAELYRAADPETDVPTCPGWTLRKLVTHVGRGDRGPPRSSASGPSTTSTSAPWPAVDRRPTGDGVAGWLRRRRRRAAGRGGRASGRTTPVWTFVGPQPARWWIRRRLHEATVHRADAALAVGA